VNLALRNDTIDFYKKKRRNQMKTIQLNIPVRIVWNACSTLVESKADVSINETPFFSKIIKEMNFKFPKKRIILYRKMLWLHHLVPNVNVVNRIYYPRVK
jgi:hypothetical protein